MTILSVEEQGPGRTGKRSLSDGKQDRSYTRLWKVQTDGDDGAIAVMDAIPLILGDSYSNGSEFDTNVFVSDISANCVDQTIWDVVATYSLWNPAYNQINPLDCRPRVSFQWMQFDEVYDIDVNGKPVVASNGLLFDPPTTRQASLPILSITRNEPTYPAIALSSHDTVNKDVFLGCDKHTVKLSNIQAHDDFDPSIGKYWVVDYEFAFDPGQFLKNIVDMGLMKLDPSSPTGYSKIKTADGSEITEPVPLDGTGQPLAPPVTKANAVILTFTPYNETDFTIFGFDTTIFT